MPFRLYLFFLVFIPVPALTGESEETEFLVITSESTPVERLTAFQLRNIFLGKLEFIKTERVFAVQIHEKRDISQSFQIWLFGNHFDWSGYWNDQRIMGNRTKPVSIGSSALMLAYLERHRGCFGYIHKDRMGDLEGFNVKVVSFVR